jgi:hypothetical protein
MENKTLAHLLYAPPTPFLLFFIHYSLNQLVSGKIFLHYRNQSEKKYKLSTKVKTQKERAAD